MANVSEKFGLRPYKTLGGHAWNNQQNEYPIASGESSDLVIPATDGDIERHTAGNGQAVLGVFNGCFYTDPTTKKPTFSNYYPGSITASDIVANVIDDPNTLFLIDADAAFTRAGLFKGYKTTNVTGNTDTGISKVQLDVSETDTTNNFPIMAVDICKDVNNEDTGNANANVIVKIQNHFFLHNSTADTGLA